MAENSKIEWTHHTFNPWIGCAKVGPGCDHCYAERMDIRFGGGHWGPGAPRRRTSPANWELPLRWNRQAAKRGERYRVFCASLADWLDNEIPIDWLTDLLDLIRQTPNLDWLLLSKRIGNCRPRLELATFRLRNDISRNDRMQATMEWIQDWLDGDAPGNVWLGATVVNQEEADRDIPKLLKVPAAMRFLSMEPLLGPVDLRWCSWCGAFGKHDCYESGDDTAGIDWVIVGGESGPGARPMNANWARDLRDQCQAAGVPFLFKQWGEFAPNWFIGDDGKKDGPEWMDRMGKKVAGRTLDGRTWDEVPASPADMFAG